METKPQLAARRGTNGEQWSSTRPTADHSTSGAIERSAGHDRWLPPGAGRRQRLRRHMQQLARWPLGLDPAEQVQPNVDTTYRVHRLEKRKEIV